MRVLTINGFGRFLGELAAEREIQHYALCPPAQVPNVQAQGLAVEATAYETKSKIDINAIKTVRRAIESVSPDIVHAFYGKPLANAVLATRRMKNPPAIVSYRGIAEPPSRLDPGDHISYLNSKVTAHACESAAVCEAMVQGGVAANTCFPVYNFVDCPAEAPGRESAVWKALEIPKDAFVVGTMATMRPVKGIDLLLEAAIRCADLPNIYWLLFGSVKHRRVRRLAANPRIRDRVRFGGFRPDASQLIGDVDVFAMPSRNEALCRSLLEAMWQKVCPVVSDAGGMKEAVRHERDGIVVPRRNSQALSDAIRTLYCDASLRSRYAASARERMESQFTERQFTDRVLGIYRGIFGGAAPRRSAA